MDSFLCRVLSCVVHAAGATLPAVPEQFLDVLDGNDANSSSLVVVTRDEARQHFRKSERRLLCSSRLITPLLEQHWQDEIALRVERMWTASRVLRRAVVLQTAATQVPVEIALLTVFLDNLPAKTAAEVQRARQPFGTVLESHQVEQQHSPAVFALTSPEDVRLACTFFGLLQSEEAQSEQLPDRIAGRLNTISDRAGNVMALSLELLRPVHGAALLV
ncbi:MAG: hypothetical protein MHM6MM_000761 [Cercozoa sp. M6MM]